MSLLQLLLLFLFFFSFLLNLPLSLSLLFFYPSCLQLFLLHLFNFFLFLSFSLLYSLQLGISLSLLFLFKNFFLFLFFLGSLPLLCLQLCLFLSNSLVFCLGFFDSLLFDFFTSLFFCLFPKFLLCLFAKLLLYFFCFFLSPQLLQSQLLSLLSSSFLIFLTYSLFSFDLLLPSHRLQSLLLFCFKLKSSLSFFLLFSYPLLLHPLCCFQLLPFLLNFYQSFFLFLSNSFSLSFFCFFLQFSQSLFFSLSLGFFFPLLSFFLLLFHPQSLPLLLLSSLFLSLKTKFFLSNFLLLLCLLQLFGLSLSPLFQFKLVFKHFLESSLFFLPLPLHLLLSLSLLSLSTLLLSLTLQFFNFKLILNSSFRLTLYDTSFVSLQKFIRISRCFNIKVGIRSQLRYFPILKLHVQQLQLLLTSKLYHYLILLLKLSNPTDSVLFKGCSDGLVREESGVGTTLDDEKGVGIHLGQ